MAMYNFLRNSAFFFSVPLQLLIKTSRKLSESKKKHETMVYTRFAKGNVPFEHCVAFMIVSVVMVVVQSRLSDMYERLS